MVQFLLSIDYWLFKQINSIYTCGLADSFFIWITDLHKTKYFAAVVIPILYFFVKKYKRQGFTLFFYLLLALGTNDFIGGKIKYVFERTRPFDNIELQAVHRTDAGSFSFYSNHAANMFALAIYVGAFFPIARWPLFILASLVAYSRVYNGVHYPSDVIAGALIGIFWAWLFVKLVTKLNLWLASRKKTL